MSPLNGPQQIATALRAVGLDDDAARLVAWADPARRERETAEQALADLAVAQTQLRTALGGLVSLSDRRWRVAAGARRSRVAVPAE